MSWSNLLERRFGLRGAGTSAGTEVRAGVVTFLTLSYILFVNPQILSQAGLPAGDVATATALAAALATAVMGLWANLPFALAPGMGLNAYFTYGVVLGMGVPWPTALAAVFVEGLLFLALSLSGARRSLMRAIPAAIRGSIPGGIGLFLAFIGLRGAGVVVDDPATLVSLGDLTSPVALLALGGLVATAALLAAGFRGAILVGILGVTAVAWATGWAEAPAALVGLPSLPRETFFALDLSGLLDGRLLPVVVAFLFVDLFDTAGTLLGVGKIAGFVDEEGELLRADRAFVADALGTSAGALLGTSTVTTYIESATGVEEGGRTGLTAVVIAGLMLASLVFTPLLVAVPAVATAPALVLVGALMMGGLGGVDWKRADEALPAFLTLVAMPLTYSIANGISLGLVSHTAIRLATGRWREVHPLMLVLSALLAAFYAWR